MTKRILNARMRNTVALGLVYMNCVAALAQAPSSTDGGCQGVVDALPPPQQESRSAHALGSELQGRWQPVHANWKPAVRSASSKRPVSNSALLPEAQTLHITGNYVLRNDQYGELCIEVVDDPKFVSRPALLPGQSVAWWEQRTLVIKQIAADGHSFTQERYVPLDAATVELTRRHVTPGAASLISGERVMLRRQNPALP